MSPERHSRVRELFLQVVDVEDDRRADWLDDHCDDPEVRKEVESLLRFHSPKTVLTPRAADTATGTAPAPAREFRNAGTAAPTGDGERRRNLFLSVAALVGLVLVGWWTRARMEDGLHQFLRAQLETTLVAGIAALDARFENETRRVADTGNDADVVEAVRELLATDIDDRPTSPALRRLDADIELDASHVGWAVVGLDDLSFLGLHFEGSRESIGSVLDPVKADGLRRAVLRGESVIEVREKGTLSLESVPTGELLMSAIGPVAARGEAPLAMLAIVFDPDVHLNTLLETLRSGDTGETYAINADGVLISPIRHHQDLRDAGRLEEGQDPVLTFEVLDDEGNRTAMAADVLAMRRERRDEIVVDTNGYPDYRGVPVVGAWTWLERYDFGVAYEIDRAEAYGALTYLKVMFWVLFGLLGLSVVMNLGSTLLIHRLHRRIEKVRQLGQYTLDELIGEGGLGKVYKARHAMLRRPTAVKFLRPEKVSKDALGRFEREVQLTAQLTHPNTIEVYDYGRTPEGVFYYAMEYVPGITLSKLVDEDGPVPAARVIAILRQVCSSLQEAHGIGLVHRDIKPLNIMLCMRGGQADVAKVLDFGLVKPIDLPAELDISGTATITGTPMYIAPERLQDPGPSDARSDLYSVGAVAFRLLAGEDVFEATGAFEIFTAALHDRIRRVSEVSDDVPADLDQLVADLLEKDPHDRPASAAAVIDRLDALDVPPWTQLEARRWWRENASRFGLEEVTRTHDVVELLQPRP